jgi:hypothetical protein
MIDEEYRATVKCPQCKKEYELKTSDKKLLIDVPLCFECHMNSYASKK